MTRGPACANFAHEEVASVDLVLDLHIFLLI